MNTRKLDEYIETAKRRIEFLDHRINWRDEKSKTHYDVKEYFALSWLIRFAEDNYMRAVEHQNKWFEEELRNGKV